MAAQSASATILKGTFSRALPAVHLPRKQVPPQNDVLNSIPRVLGRDLTPLPMSAYGLVKP